MVDPWAEPHRVPIVGSRAKASQDCDPKAVVDTSWVTSTKLASPGLTVVHRYEAEVPPRQLRGGVIFSSTVVTRDQSFLRISSSRSLSSSSNSGILRRSVSMSQWVRCGF